MSKPICYLSGPIAGCSLEEIHAWREDWKKRWGAENCRDPARRVWGPKEGWEYFEEIVETDLDDIYESDIILTYYSHPTCGTLMENVHGWNEDKLIVIVCKTQEVYDNLSPWIIYHANHIVLSFDEAENVIIEEYK